MWVFIVVSLIAVEVACGLFFFSLIWASHQAAEWEERDLNGAMPGAAAFASSVFGILAPGAADRARHG
ncbi:MAG: hypothetical protein ACLGJD_02825 [Gammaproteobacteria bacterium]|jgi:hypothetical protein|uniref:hypothetical protein n=1 Tax=unclassified Pseudacidovorax TaxID=2620592 RepID=UPI001B3E23C4|nr:hypothetical protein [Pseudacidovorax sp.]MBP6894608.1 hypothetical protein [Pseudacidovorax sp.]